MRIKIHQSQGNVKMKSRKNEENSRTSNASKAQQWHTQVDSISKRGTWKVQAQYLYTFGKIPVIEDVYY